MTLVTKVRAYIFVRHLVAVTFAACFMLAPAHGAETINRISISPLKTGAQIDMMQKLPAGLVDAQRGDRMELHVGSGGRHTFLITQSNRSKLGNSIIRAAAPGGGKSLFVLDPNGGIIGQFEDSEGLLQVTTDEYGVVTLWREGVDTLAVPFTDDTANDVELPTKDVSSRNMRALEKSDQIQTKKYVPIEAQPQIVYPRYGFGHAVVTILIYFDQDMEEYIGPLADFLIELTNDAFEDSGADLSLELAEMLPVELEKTLTTAEILDLMRGEDFPFETLKGERDHQAADLVATLTDTPIGGRAQLGGRFSPAYLSVTGYSRYEPGQPFYSSTTFAHEIGHNLGANHNREEYTQEEIATVDYTFSYAYGYGEFDSHITIMSYMQGYSTIFAPYYSNTDVTYQNLTLGIPYREPEAADVSRAFNANRHSAAALRNEGKYFASTVRVGAFIGESDCGRDLEEDDPRGQYRRAYIYASDSSIEIHSEHLIRPDGSDYVYRYSPGSTYGSVYFCRFAEDGSNPLGTEYVESYFRYYHPISGELVESAHVLWDEDYDGPYREVRIAHSDGGQVAGNTNLLLKEGRDYTIDFESDPGFNLADVDSTCGGNRYGSSFTITPTRDDCRVEATFEDGGSSKRSQDRFTSLLGFIQNPAELLPPEPTVESQFIGTYHVYRNQRLGREDVLRIGANNSVSFGSNFGRYRWQVEGNSLDIYYMFSLDPEDPATGDYRFTLTLGESEGGVEIIESNGSGWNDFYAEKESRNSEYLFDLYELGTAYASNVYQCFNIGKGYSAYGTFPWYSANPFPTTSSSLEECQSYCAPALAYTKEQYPDNEDIQNQICEGDEEAD